MDKQDEQPKNPQAALDAISNPAPLTMAKVALLERIKSPLLFGETNDTVNNIVALYVVSGVVKPGEIIKAFAADELTNNALEWVDTLDPKVFTEKLAAALDSIAAFWKMLPRPESDGNADGDPSKVDGPSKKGSASETASSPS